MSKTKTQWNPREATAGQWIINRYGVEARVIELLPDDPEYFARLEDRKGNTWGALAENSAKWKPKTPKP